MYILLTVCLSKSNQLVSELQTVSASTGDVAENDIVAVVWQMHLTNKTAITQYEQNNEIQHATFKQMVMDVGFM